MWTRKLHHAAEREVRSGNLVPFGTRGFFVSIVLRLALRTSRQAGLLRLLAAGTQIKGGIHKSVFWRRSIPPPVP